MTILILFTLLQLADGWTTYRILQIGGRELNPVMRWLFARVGSTPVIVVAKAGAIAVAYWLLGIQYGPEAVGGLCIVYGLVVWNNVNVLERMQ